MTDMIIVLDFGSQTSQLIARRVREMGVYSEVVPFQKAAEAFARMKPRAVILSGGPASPAEANSPRAPQIVFEAGVPVLGICYGQMLLAAQLGGKVESGHHREFGRAEVSVKAPSALFEGVWSDGAKHTVWMSHGDRVTAIPPGFKVVATSEGAPFAAIADEARQFYATQFHMEVVEDKDALAATAKEKGFDSWAAYYLDRNSWYLNPDRPTTDPWMATSALSEQLFIMQRNPYYWQVDEDGNQLPYCDELTHRLFETVDVFNMWILNGEIDYQGRHVELSNYTLFRSGEEKGGYLVHTANNDATQSCASTRRSRSRSCASSWATPTAARRCRWPSTARRSSS